ncbi:MAG: helix-turn-helix transcriptional regulator [Porphyromonas sp.]|uniref:helix-turn-helix domain-containing protein n=1 Tax=Porphyromonas sp. TaxID=1924944 RepID=UPI002A74A983|nr:helix-turn-helix transcriptional regulator [Porphyromonas sp.]MDY3111947.1 helix-turn-helix transcriptional regulator [Porphyromonas sp.]
MLLIESEGIIERVRYMMESMELNATAFATEAGITPSVISHMLNGRNRPTIETLNNIIAAYPSWSYEWLLFGKGTPKREEQSVSLPIESSLFGSYEASAPSSQTAHATPSSESTLQSGLTSIPFTSEEVEQIRQVLLQQHTATREVSEIRIFYSDGSYEIFVPQSSAK